MSKKQKQPEDPKLPINLDPESDLPPDADIEERFNDFWKKNGVSIFGGIALGAAIVIGIQLFQHLDQKKEDAIRAEFNAAQTVEEKIQFAEKHPDHQLAGLAQLLVADSKYEEGDFAEAAQLYGETSRIFEDPTIASRAVLGQGISLLQAGDKENGRSVLKAIALDGTALDQTRAEAAYHLAISYWEDGDNEAALEMTDVILQLESAQFWAYRANLLKDRLQ